MAAEDPLDLDRRLEAAEELEPVLAERRARDLLLGDERADGGKVVVVRRRAADDDDHLEEVEDRRDREDERGQVDRLEDEQEREDPARPLGEDERDGGQVGDHRIKSLGRHARRAAVAAGREGAAGVLLFVLVNVEIADFYSTGPTLTGMWESSRATRASSRCCGGTTR